MRRSPGEGSVYQRSDGKWEASLSIGRTATGKRRRLKVVAATRREAVARLTERRKAELATASADNARMTVADWLHRWLEEEVRTSVRPRTYIVYEVTVRCHLIPSLGPVLLRQLSAADVKAFMLKQIANGLTASSVLTQHSILRRALQVATRYDLVERNVARLVSPPRVERAEIHPLSREDTRRFLAVASQHWLGALFVLTAATGMRLGEVLGLTWGSVDLDAGFVRVEHTLARYYRGYHIDPPKTAHSRRAIAIPPAVVDVLRTHRRRELERRRAVGAAWLGNDWDLVFTSRTGRPLSARTVKDIFERLLDDAGVRRIRFHDLRHGAATFLLMQGVPMKVVQDVLGHAQIALTADLYSHVVPELRREAADRMGVALFGA